MANQFDDIDLGNKWMFDPYLLARNFHAFAEFVQEQSGMPFVSFASNPYTEKEEGYKADIYRQARHNLDFQNWRANDIGTGKIVQEAISAIELELTTSIRQKI